MKRRVHTTYTMKNRTICNLLAISITLAILASAVAIGANTNASPLMQTLELFNPTPAHILITEVYYDTYVKGDTNGEFIRIHNPTNSSINISGWQLTDNEGVITFPCRTVISAGDSRYLAYNATAFYEAMQMKPDFEYGVDSDPTVLEMTKTRNGIKLHNDGDELILMDNRDNVVDVVIYGNSNYKGAGWSGPAVKDVKYGVVLERDRTEPRLEYEDTDSASDWDDFRVYVVGQSHFPYATFDFNGTLTLFTSPDSSFKVIASAIENAKETIYLNVYQFHNFYLMDHLINAIMSGIVVKVMLEGDPVGGIADEERYIAEQIVNAGGEVRYMINDKANGIYDRYRFNHAKYAILDDQLTIVTSENWKNTGVPVNNTFGNRGWGVIINNTNVTDYFSDVFFDDWKPESRDSFPFTSGHPIYGGPSHGFEPNRTIMTGNYTHPFDSVKLSGEFSVSPILAPDTSLMETMSIIGMLKGAKESVYVQQLYIYRDWNSCTDNKNPFLDAAINAARRGCDVKILLNPTYSFETNEATIEYLRAIAANEGLNMSAKFADTERTGLNKTHNKGVIVDRSKVLISSINWNENSAMNNREVGVIIDNDAVGEYYTDVFLYDWNSTNIQPPIVTTVSKKPSFEHHAILMRLRIGLS